MSGKSDNPERPVRTAADRAATEPRDRIAMRTGGRPAGRDERRKLRNLLGDYAEQTGSFFG